MGHTLSAVGVAALLLRGADAALIEVKMAQISYAPAQVSAHVGDTVEWVNDDIVAHTATPRNGAWDEWWRPTPKAGSCSSRPARLSITAGSTRTWSGRSRCPN